MKKFLFIIFSLSAASLYASDFKITCSDDGFANFRDTLNNTVIELGDQELIVPDVILGATAAELIAESKSHRVYLSRLDNEVGFELVKKTSATTGILKGYVSYSLFDKNPISFNLQDNKNGKVEVVFIGCQIEKN